MTEQRWTTDELDRIGGADELHIAPLGKHGALRRPTPIEKVVRMVEHGELATRVADTYPAVEAVAAHQRLERGGLRGRLILEFQTRTPSPAAAEAQ